MLDWRKLRDEFVERGKEIDSRFRDSQGGSRYPAGLGIDEKTSIWAIDKCLNWFRDWVYSEFAKEISNPQNNRKLYQFFCTLSDRRDRLAYYLRHITGDLRLHNPVRLSGCYFAATGQDPSRQAFIPGVLNRVISQQNDVAWQSEWIARDRWMWIWTVVALFLLLFFLGLNGWLTK